MIRASVFLGARTAYGCPVMGLPSWEASSCSGTWHGCGLQRARGRLVGAGRSRSSQNTPRARTGARARARSVQYSAGIACCAPIWRARGVKKAGRRATTRAVRAGLFTLLGGWNGMDECAVRGAGGAGEEYAADLTVRCQILWENERS